MEYSRLFRDRLGNHIWSYNHLFFIQILSYSNLILIKGFLEGLRPEPVISVSEWADTYRYLPETSARPGKFNTSITPYTREPFDRLSVHDRAQEVFVMKGAQTGFTEGANNWIGYIIDVAPHGTLYAMPTETMMKITSKTRIEKMIESTPTLREKITLQKRDKNNTLLYKEFRGGFLNMIGANSSVGFSSMAVRFVYLDEVDRYPLDVAGEGSAFILAKTRTTSFGARRKICLTSTPTIKGMSAIEAAFENTGQRYFHVPCPHCGHYQILVIDNLKYEPGDYSDVRYECCECHQLIEERHKTRMLNAGKWVAKYPEREDGIRYGYHISSMYSPYGWYSWAEMVQERDEALNDLPKWIAFVNTKLGECYEAAQAEKIEWESIYNRTIDYPKNKPYSSVVFLTAGVDVQGDRLELEIVGWIKGKTSQSIDYRVIVGDTSQSAVWEELGKVLSETWVREDGAIMPLKLMALDTGYNTAKAYDFVKKHGISRVIPVKGRDNLDVFYTAPKAIEVTRAGKKLGRLKVFHLGVSIIKTEVYGNLRLIVNPETGEVPNGFMYLPKREPNYFKGLVGEELVRIVDKKGFVKYVWKRVFRQNEPLDTRVYARAAAAVNGMDRWSDERWDRESLDYTMQEETPKPIKKAKKVGSFLDKWK